MKCGIFDARTARQVIAVISFLRAFALRRNAVHTSREILKGSIAKSRSWNTGSTKFTQKAQMSFEDEL